MNTKNPFRALSRMELGLWLTSLVVVSVSFLAVPEKDYLTLIASLIGVTALIFVAKGYVLGQILIVVFSLFYGVISFYFQYYGEMITYLGMSAPIAVCAVISWLRHPYRQTAEVQVRRMTGKQWAWMLSMTALVTVLFYFVLKWLGTANLLFSTISVATSFLASYLTFMRSPFYGLAYGANDVVLIVLWILASVEELSYLPMVLCFLMFLLNDLYGFWQWRRMQKRQERGETV